MDEMSKLKWQCRRGTRELDLLLIRYLEDRLPIADQSEKKEFNELLKLDDYALFEYIKDRMALTTAK